MSARGKTTPESTPGSYAPHAGRVSRVEVPTDSAGDTAAAHEVTYTLDALKDGKYHSDYGLTAAEVAAARANADRLGVTILAVNEERPVSMSDLRPFGVTDTSGADDRKARQAAFNAEHAGDPVVVWAVGGPVIASFGHDDDAARRAWSQAFDTALDEYGRGQHDIRYLFEYCREKAIANGAPRDEDTEDEERRSFRRYLGFHATIDDHWGTVDMDQPPRHDLPLMRDTPEGMVRVEASIGGDPSASERTVWLVDPDEYATRSEFGFVIDPDRHQQILNMGDDDQ